MSAPAQDGAGRNHVVLVASDGSGVTGERVVRAVLTQFDEESVQVERVPDVRDEHAAAAVVEQAARRRATLLFSLVLPEPRRVIIRESLRLHVTTVDLLGPILQRLSEVLEASPRAQPGLFQHLDEEYLRRIDAIHFAVKHDDGQAASELPLADIVLAGVSRTTKTPLSMFLAYRGWKAANVPIVFGIEPPPELLAVPPEKVVGLTAGAAWLEEIRRERELRMTGGRTTGYSDEEEIRRELVWFRQIAARRGWRLLDVTRKAIEETAAEVVALVRR